MNSESISELRIRAKRLGIPLGGQFDHYADAFAIFTSQDLASMKLEDGKVEALEEKVRTIQERN